MAHPNYDWLIVQHHKSTASVGDHLADKDIQYYVEAGFERVMSEQGVDFVLAGHDHVYARSYPLSGRGGGLVSVPNKEFPAASGSTWKNPGDPIYLTFTTASGLKYYHVSSNTAFNYANSLYVQNNTTYPYLGESTTGDGSTYFGSLAYMNDKRMPVSNAAYVQPYIPSYSVVEVDGRSITFKTYPIATASGTSPGATTPYSYDATVPYDSITVTK
jgi:3',5'-cyclic AMP phosphodiesterase CpdA